MDYQCEVSYPLPPALHYLWWLMAYHMIRILCLRQVTLPWNTPQGMVMLSNRGYIDPIVKMGKDTLERCYNTLMQVAMNGSFCIANLSTKDFLMVLALIGFGLHLCLHILGCFAACRTVVEAPQRGTLLFDRKG